MSGLSGRLAPVLIRRLFALVLLCLAPAALHAQTFPQLTGPVVDAAGVLPPDAEARLSQKLLALQTQSQRQLQVVTVPSLEGYDLSDYANRLFRSWQLGDAKRNDGAMLLIAPNDRKVRIEVGYGLEGIVTDGLSFLIIQQQIVPRFKAGDLPGGIEAGTDALIQQLTLPDDQARQLAAQAQSDSTGDRGIPIGTIIWLLIFLFFFVLPMIRRVSGGRSYGGSGLGPIIVWNTLDGISRGGGGWGGGGGFGGGGGGWGGGGGSSGGGGASGSW